MRALPTSVGVSRTRRRSNPGDSVSGIEGRLKCYEENKLFVFFKGNCRSRLVSFGGKVEIYFDSDEKEGFSY